MVRVYQVFGERVYLFVLVGEVCLGYSRARYRRPSPGFDPAHPRFSIGIVWIGGTVESTYTVYTVLMVVDRLSKRIHAVPTVASLDSAGVARLFLEHVWHLHRLLEEVISDRRPTFVSNFSRELDALLGVKLTPSTSYHPQTDGQMERVNQEIEAYLRVFVSHRQDDWADWLPLVEFAYNNKVHAATCRTLFELDAGQHPCLGVEPMRTSTVEAADTFTRRLDRAQEEAKATLEQAADDMKWYYDQNRQAALEYKVGDRVWLSLQNYSSDHPMKKLDHKWAGPFLITKVVSPAAIKLRLSA